MDRQQCISFSTSCLKAQVDVFQINVSLGKEDGEHAWKRIISSLFSRKLVACEGRMDKGGRGEEEIIGSPLGGRKGHQSINQLWLFTNFRAC